MVLWMDAFTQCYGRLRDSWERSNPCSRCYSSSQEHSVSMEHKGNKIFNWKWGMAVLLNLASKPGSSRDQQLCNKVQILGEKTLAEVREVSVLPAIVQNTQEWDKKCLSIQRALLTRAHVFPSAEGNEGVFGLFGWFREVSLSHKHVISSCFLAGRLKNRHFPPPSEHAPLWCKTEQQYRKSLKQKHIDFNFFKNVTHVPCS